MPDRLNCLPVPEREFDLTAARGLRLSGREWLPATPARAVIALVHGFGEHMGRWAHVAEWFATRGLAAVALDLRGHGRSEGRRGHALKLEYLLDDVGLLVAEARRAHPDTPLFLYGHSLGALLAANYVLRSAPTLTGVILSALPLDSPLKEQRLKVAAARWLGPLLPALSIDSGLDHATLSRDPAVVDACASDPLVHSTATLGLAHAALEAVEYARAHTSEWHVPVLIMHGTGDQLALPSGSEEFARHIHGDCTLKLWPGLYHELHNEPEKQEVLSFVAEWIEKRAEPRP